MNTLREVNIKYDMPTADQAVKRTTFEIENARRLGVKCVKIVHGYGSHGRGGAILVALRQMLSTYKKQKRIVDYFGGDRWNIFDKETLEILNKDKTIYNDEDMGKANPGITIIVLK